MKHITRHLAAVGLAGALFAAGFGTAVAVSKDKPAAPEAQVKELMDNARVTVREIVLAPGSARAARARPTDELVLFPEEAHYQATDAAGKVSPRDRKPNEVVWHEKGEQAPTLSNPTKKTVRYFSISLK
jgi:hypothetical protein